MKTKVTYTQLLMIFAEYVEDLKAYGEELPEWRDVRKHYKMVR